MAFESLGTWNPILKEEKKCEIGIRVGRMSNFCDQVYEVIYVERACRPAYNFGYSYVQY